LFLGVAVVFVVVAANVAGSGPDVHVFTFGYRFFVTGRKDGRNPLRVDLGIVVIADVSVTESNLLTRVDRLIRRRVEDVVADVVAHEKRLQPRAPEVVERNAELIASNVVHAFTLRYAMK
jgi:hypothetical protein